MAPNTYYYAFSFAAVFGAAFHLANMLYFRKQKMLLTGESFKKGSREYELSLRLSNRRNLTLTGVILLLTLSNFAYCVYRNIDLFGLEYYQGLFLLITPFVLLGLAFLFIHFRVLNNKRGNHRRS